MDYSRATPLARSGTSGISMEKDIGTDEAYWISPPDRLAAVTVAVHITDGETAEYAIEATCNRVENLENGTAGYWDAVEMEHPTYTESRVIMLCNAVTGIRVRCISASSIINVCFCG